MSSPLSGISVDKRRHAAATVGLFAMLFVTIGAVAATGRSSAAAPVFSIVSLVIAVLLGMIAWGILRSVSADLAERRLDEAIEATLASKPEYASLCNCGHEHDPNVLHVTDEETAEGCAHDGGGVACAHDCGSCVLATMRPSPRQTRAERLDHPVS